MNDLVKSPAPAPPADVISPSELAARINAAHEQVKQSARRGVQHALEAGRLLIEAQNKVRYGNWVEWIGTNCDFAERTAQIYMQLVREWHRLGELDPQRIADLTLNDAIKLIAQLINPEPRLPSSGRAGGKRRDPTDAAIKKDPLAVLKRAWDEAGQRERDLFKKQIGV